ncbi:MAM and LDL-receptor class A domain-containing protein 1-like [Antedon mediterranea]|uniref:MAM and LDL-receptor class A domain-containing protein 1-like n=1 Tax=Antedon mediterranea TaxID=105859 RepID=UPI003AF72D60
MCIPTEKIYCITIITSFLTCDFEDVNLCGYVQDQNDVFDWTRKTGSTGTTNTGPPTDVTYGTGYGNYLYIETSSPRKMGDLARLFSTTHTFESNKPTQCWHFYYHMFGVNMGTLNFGYRVNGNNQVLWTRSGDYGDRWIQGVVEISSSQNYEIFLEGIRGNGIRSDISIDEISYVDGKCPGAGECNFENGYCLYYNSLDDEFDWLRGQGSTTSASTGPNTDHTVGDGTGYYMFIETSSPQATGDSARLVSEIFDATSGKCVTFWYHMFGLDIGYLNIYVAEYNGTNEVKSWSLYGQQSTDQDLWLSGQLGIVSPFKWIVIFEGIKGSDFRGDIAIDDVVFLDNDCQIQPAIADPANSINADIICDFEVNFCGWKQETLKDDFDWTRTNIETPSLGSGPGSDHTTGNGNKCCICFENYE